MNPRLTFGLAISVLDRHKTSTPRLEHGYPDCRRTTTSASNRLSIWTAATPPVTVSHSRLTSSSLLVFDMAIHSVLSPQCLSHHYLLQDLLPLLGCSTSQTYALPQCSISLRLHNRILLIKDSALSIHRVYIYPTLYRSRARFVTSA